MTKISYFWESMLECLRQVYLKSTSYFFAFEEMNNFLGPLTQRSTLRRQALKLPLCQWNHQNN